MTTTKIIVLVLISCSLHFIPIHCASDELLESWNKINTNYANDIQQSNKIYYKIKKEQKSLSDLRNIVERHLRTKNAELLVNAINSNNISMPENNLKEIFKQFSETYDNDLVESIVAEAINEIILKGQIVTLPDLLWSIYQENDGKSFENMLRAELQLYNSFGQKSHSDAKKFLHLMANRLYKIKQDRLYNGVDLGLKEKVQKIIEQLPYNLKYLYFMPYFCLLNVKYSTYLYTAIDAKVDPLSRYIWLWHDSKSMDDTGHTTAEVAELNTNSDSELKVALKSNKYNLYYYMMPSTMQIAGWESPNAPLNYIWDIDFLDDDHVVFSQNNHLMCAVENYDGERRNVGGRKLGQVSSKSSECQWRLGRCVYK